MALLRPLRAVAGLLAFTSGFCFVLRFETWVTPVYSLRIACASTAERAKRRDARRHSRAPPP
ncbi:hypothetical protein AQ765_07750 [Burkholderia pseudomallei]|uniref:Uncharacterized protein n=1 Tax=Burkholderia pseudomallei 1710a TaxID=320371 RepID=A0A0E1VYD5_BURPE|nr:hypothetical protein ACT79_06035 [Burkholderia pseudomallei]AOP69967.1 hypothetical protein BHL98_01450 [Burkholderia mallei]EEH29997.1 conserved hypothetical protein [Burkholderia pseudomallei Pakistan 9]EEP51114.1 conserved hypothetical protein [Burkholderia pseudomallei MSHR346]EET05970.1 hypothetical protein BURPS1710A_A2155 [Burkholderia pseudomallei 1710a]EXJ02892.1 hypothetical protein T210_0104695 [Burkholderia pseudomallei MSHR6137]KEO66308.1 hypothetical protein J103_27855 [Burkh